jgi:hypothetical protein
MWKKIPIGTTLSLWRNPPMGEQRAVNIWRRKDTHRDNPVTMEESACGGADSCHHVEKERYL